MLKLNRRIFFSYFINYTAPAIANKMTGSVSMSQSICFRLIVPKQSPRGLLSSSK
jgi:hypothetical protein